MTAVRFFSAVLRSANRLVLKDGRGNGARPFARPEVAA
jgi:hypothetical protein